MNIENVHAEYYDSEDKSNRRVNVTIHGGSATLAKRDHPSDVWGPPIKLYLDKSHIAGEDDILRNLHNPDLARDMMRGK